MAAFTGNKDKALQIGIAAHARLIVRHRQKTMSQRLDEESETLGLFKELVLAGFLQNDLRMIIGFEDGMFSRRN